MEQRGFFLHIQIWESMRQELKKETGQPMDILFIILKINLYKDRKECKPKWQKIFNLGYY